jgi:hypothetical protein
MENDQAGVPSRSAARQSAETLWQMKEEGDVEARTLQHEAQAKEAANTARLRELRLAQEAADKIVAGPPKLIKRKTKAARCGAG